jgi:thiol-disulfide isomerase/thioredoxin
MIVNIKSREDFDKLVAEPLSLAVFGSEHCGFCRATKPALNAYATANPTVVVGWVDVDRMVALPAVRKVRVLPTLVVYSAGQQVRRATGQQSMAEVEKLVQP